MLHRKLLLTFLILVVLILNPLFAQTTDSTKSFQVDEVIVVADRFETKLFTSTSAALKFNSESLKKLPINSGVELLKYIPGFSVSSSSGLYSSPIVTPRGFYGGGEADYLALYIDNIQINDIETGLIDWSLLSNSFLNNIKLSKGGSSSLYGDFALGGVIDIQTFKNKDATNLSIGAGSFNTNKLDFLTTNSFNNARLNVFGNIFKTDGFRKHSQNNNYSFGGNFIYSINQKSTFRFSTLNNFVDEELPGALADVDELDYYSSDSYYKLDKNSSKKIRFNIGYDYLINQNSKLTFDLNYINKNSSKVRTFTNSTPIIDPTIFAPIGVYDTTLYGDTKNSELKTNVLHTKANYFANFPEISTKVIAGVEYQRSNYENKTFDLYNGFKDDYEMLDDYNAKKVVEGSGNRNKFTSYINLKSKILGNLNINVGLRYDYILDDYIGTIPDTSVNICNKSFSPKIGINYKYSDTQNYKASIYGNINRAFKAPTVEQLLDFDELNFGIFIPISPTHLIFQNIKASPFGNASLKPQTSSNFEFGTYQEIILYSQTSINLNGAFYYSKIKNEIDFDLQTFKYENINESKHLGFELGLGADISNFSIFTNYAYTLAESLAKAQKGFQLKGIPKNVFSIGVSYLFKFGLNIALASNSATEQYLDDTNENRLPDYTTWDGKLGYKFEFVNINLTINNIFDKKYYTMGYSIDGTNYLYPMAERNLFVQLAFKF